MALTRRRTLPVSPATSPTRLANIWLAATMRYAILIAFVFIFLTPIVWIALLSLKTRREYAQNPLGLPGDPQWENYSAAWNQGRFNVYLPNTVYYAVAVVVGVAILASLAGYALAKTSFPGRDAIFTLFLLGMTLPFLSLMIPTFYLARDLGLLGTRWGYIIPAIATGLPFSIFLMRTFFAGIPDELADAARVDGCTQWGVFRRIMLPLAWPGLATLAVFQFLGTWSAFLMPLVLVQRDSLRPVALALPLFQGRYNADLPLIAAASMITILPALLIYLALQRRFIEGVTAGALK